jgi:DNA-binding LacI/PurR family transcriptional regulator
VLRGAQRAARAAGYAVALVDAGRDRDWEIASIEALRAGPADGVLLFGIDPPPGATGNAVAIEVAPGALPVVRLDVDGGTDAAASHLLELGHRRVGHLAAAVGASTFRARAARLRARLAAAGLEPAGVAAGPIEFDGAAEAAAPLLQAGCTAVFCDDDVLAGGMYLAARRAKVAIPDELSVVGFDDLDFARVLEPPLTTVAADAEALGAAAFAALAADLAGEPVAAEQVLPVRLIVRGSTAAPAQTMS